MRKCSWIALWVAGGLVAAWWLSGCGSAARSPLCGTLCATVQGVVERCGGPGPGRCKLQPVGSVVLRNDRGQVAARHAALHGGTIDTFFLLAEVPGRYTVQTRIRDLLVERKVELRAGESARVKLVLRVK